MLRRVGSEHWGGINHLFWPKVVFLHRIRIIRVEPGHRHLLFWVIMLLFTTLLVFMATSSQRLDRGRFQVSWVGNLSGS